MLGSLLPFLMFGILLAALLARPLSRQHWVSLPVALVVLWGGIRGAVAIALALSLSVDIPHWYTVQSTVYGVALFSLVVQTPLVPWLSKGRRSTQVVEQPARK